MLQSKDLKTLPHTVYTNHHTTTVTIATIKFIVKLMSSDHMHTGHKETVHSLCPFDISLTIMVAIVTVVV